MATYPPKDDPSNTSVPLDLDAAAGGRRSLFAACGLVFLGIAVGSGGLVLSADVAIGGGMAAIVRWERALLVGMDCVWGRSGLVGEMVSLVGGALRVRASSASLLVRVSFEKSPGARLGVSRKRLCSAKRLRRKAAFSEVGPEAKPWR